MNWLDAVIALIFLISTLAAARKGFSREAIGLIASLIGLMLGIYYYKPAGQWLMPYVSSTNVAYFLGFLMVFIGVLIVGGIIGAIVGRLLRTVGLSWFDRLLGAAFGLARAVLVSVALVLALTAFAPGASAAAPPESVVHSRFAPYVMGASRLLTHIAPDDLKNEFHERYLAVRHAWDERDDKTQAKRNAAH